MRSGRPAAFFAAASRTPASTSKVSMNSAVAMSLGDIGTRPLAPIMRSGMGAFGSTCFWKFAGSTSSGNGHEGCAGVTASLMEARLAGLPRRQRLRAGFVFGRVLERERRIEPPSGHPPGQLAEPSVEEEIARQPRDGRRAAETESEVFVPDARV